MHIVLFCVFELATRRAALNPNQIDHLANIQLYSESQGDPERLGMAHAYEMRLCRSLYGTMPDSVYVKHLR